MILQCDRLMSSVNVLRLNLPNYCYIDAMLCRVVYTLPNEIVDGFIVILAIYDSFNTSSRSEVGECKIVEAAPVCVNPVVLI